MIKLASVGAASFVFIFLKSTQQLNVVREKYLLILPTSLAMAATEVYVIATIALETWTVPLVLSIGFGAGLGSMCATYLHRRFVMRKWR